MNYPPTDLTDHIDLLITINNVINAAADLWSGTHHATVILEADEQEVGRFDFWPNTILALPGELPATYQTITFMLWNDDETLRLYLPHVSVVS